VLAASTSLVVTLVAVLGALGWLPQDGPAAAAGGERASLSAVTIPDVTPTPDRSRVQAPAEAQLPADTGSGKRIVFDISDQRVWLVGAGDAVRRTYLVSGSLTDNLEPGTFSVYSRSRWAVGIADSGVMEYFVRFTRGENAAIGFHSIPSKDGQPLQTRAQLGTPQSHGCIRQALPDAERLWDFAPVGTKVVVTA
jgi:lipoprotein-anchoring transpeptidase ErfK/SrfK